MIMNLDTFEYTYGNADGPDPRRTLPLRSRSAMTRRPGRVQG
jgi:hypothetical protein